MDNNHFAPPRAQVTDVTPPAARPASVWLLQCLLAVLGISLSVSMVGALLMSLSQSGRSDWVFSLGYCIPMLLAWVAIVSTIVGCQRRKPYGRWLGVLWIGALLVAVGLRGVGGVVAGLQAGIPQEAVAQCIALLLPLALFGFWLHRFAFAPRARAWFGAASAHPNAANELAAATGR